MAQEKNIRSDGAKAFPYSLNQMRYELNKWNWIARGGWTSPMMIRGFSPWFTIGYFKVVSYPEQGAMYTKDNYKGVLWHWQFKWPRNLLVRVFTFVCPDWMAGHRYWRKFWPFKRRVIVICIPYLALPYSWQVKKRLCIVAIKLAWAKFLLALVKAWAWIAYGVRFDRWGRIKQ